MNPTESALRELTCCVCDEALAPDEARELGDRIFCAKHHRDALAATEAGLSRSGLTELAVVALFVAATGWLFGTDALPSSLPVALALCLLPAAALMVYVYRLDRIEPEPWGVVTGVFLLGALAGHGAVTPLLERGFEVATWQHLSPTASWVAAVLVVATTEQFVTYLVVRYSVYLTSEFDEPADGPVYAAAAALGLATAANVRFVVMSEGILPLPGAAHITTNCLIHLAAAMALGYGLGRNRFMGHPFQLWLGGFFLLSVLLNGGLTQLAALAGISGGTFYPIVSLTVAAVVGGGVVLAMDFLMARLSLESTVVHKGPAVGPQEKPV